MSNEKARETLSKFFYDIAKAVFTTMVLGMISSILILKNYSILSATISIVLGSTFTTIFAIIAYKLSK